MADSRASVNRRLENGRVVRRCIGGHDHNGKWEWLCKCKAHGDPDTSADADAASGHDADPDPDATADRRGAVRPAVVRPVRNADVHRDTDANAGITHFYGDGCPGGHLDADAHVCTYQCAGDCDTYERPGPLSDEEADRGRG